MCRCLCLGPRGRPGPLSLFWEAAHELDPAVADESRLAGARAGHLAELFEAAGIARGRRAALTVQVEHVSFEEWWEPYTLGVGPAGAYAAGLDPERQRGSASAAASCSRTRRS